jgi:hypothetical protein
MWKGSITIRDNALQLLLLVDYMCDWARDIYRPAILMELKILAKVDTETATVITDTDIFSSRGRFITQSCLDTEEVDQGSQSDENEIFAAFQQLDSGRGVVRHASIIQSRFLCIFITADNVQTFLMSMNEKIRKLSARRILNFFSSGTTASSYLLTGEALNNIENIWSGHLRLSMPFNVNQAKFHTILQLNYYLSAAWEQVRDLCVICVSEDAFDALILGSGLKAGRGKAKQPTHSACTQDTVVDCVRKVWNSSSRETLLAAISRMSCYISINDSDRRPKPNLLTECEPTIWELVNHIYKLHKTGDLEPDVSFFRISKQRNSREIDSANQELFNFKEPLKVSPQAGVLIHGSAHSTEGRMSRTSLCLYLFQSSTEPPSRMDIGSIIKDTFENFDVYHTTRNNGNLNLRDQRDVNKIWNLKDIYGMHFSYGGSSFSKWVKFLQCPVPTRQGSPRGPEDSGRSMFTRDYTPWHDPRLIYGVFALQRKKYIMKVVAGEARAWSQIAIRRQKEGIDCCEICAGPRQPTSDILDDPDYMDYLDDSGHEDENSPKSYENGQLEDESDFDDESGSIPKGMCVPCRRDTDTACEYGYPGWFKLLIFSGHIMGLTSSLAKSENITVDPPAEGYDMRTPPPSSFASFRREREGNSKFAMPDAGAILNGSLDVESADEQEPPNHENQKESLSGQVSSSQESSSQETRKRRRLN